MRLILIGPPGSGKGTQAQLLSKRLGLKHIATGDMLRTAIARGTAAGKKAEAFVNGGKLVPDELINEIIAELFRADSPQQFVFDGYPRTAVQAAALDALLQGLGLDITAVIFFEVEEEEIVRRSSGRRICPKDQTSYHVVSNPPKRDPGKCDQCGTILVQRADDREDTIRKRFSDYRHTTMELKPYYEQQSLVRVLRGQGDIETIYQAIIKASR